jgi:hypothetical protein
MTDTDRGTIRPRESTIDQLREEKSDIETWDAFLLRLLETTRDADADD